jgi:hypothetical protein
MGSSTACIQLKLKLKLKLKFSADLGGERERKRARKTSQYGDNLIPREIRNAELKK